MAARWNRVGAIVAAISIWAFALPDKHALLIGIDKYEDPAITSLTGAANDVRAVAAALVESSGFPSQNVRVLSTDQSDPSLKPTQENIGAELRRLRDRCKVGDLVIVYYSGHGTNLNGATYLVPSDTRLTDDPILLGKRMLSGAEVNAYLAAVPADLLLVIYDMCRDPGAAEKGVIGGAKQMPNPSTKDLVLVKSEAATPPRADKLVTLFACRNEDISFEDRTTKRGVFSTFFEKALRGGEDGELYDDSGNLTLLNLRRYVEANVKKTTLGEPFNREQRPRWETGGESGLEIEDYVVASGPSKQRRAAAIAERERLQQIAIEEQRKKREQEDVAAKAIAKQKEDERKAELERAKQEEERKTILKRQQEEREKEEAERLRKEKEAEDARRAQEARDAAELKRRAFQEAFDAGCRYESGDDEEKIEPDYDKAFEKLSEALRIDPDSAIALHHLGRVETFRATADPRASSDVRQRRLASAEDYLNRAVAKNPRYSWAFNDLGYFYHRFKGDLAKGESNLRKAIDLMPKDPVPRLNLAKLLWAAKRKREAENAVKEALRLNPDSAEAWQLEGNILLNENKPDEADKRYEKALSLDPQQFAALHGRAMIHKDRYIASGKNDKKLITGAMLYISRAIEICTWAKDPGAGALLGRLYADLAWVQDLAGQREDARKSAQKAVQEFGFKKTKDTEKHHIFASGLVS